MSLTRLEEDCLEACVREELSSSQLFDPDDMSVWLKLGFKIMLKAGSMTRATRLMPMRERVHFKKDGSPTTSEESQIEHYARDLLLSVNPDIQFLGEETGGEVNPKGYAAAMDPIDGTWALINRLESCSNTLVFLHDRSPFLGIISNPVTGELAYAFSGSTTRLIQFPLFGEGHAALNLPLDQIKANSILVNIQPHRTAGAIVNTLMKLWDERAIQLVQMSGGSPAFALMGVAKGNFNYINLWPSRHTEFYDLAAGIMLVRGAGGDVIDLKGRPVKQSGHLGPFVAGIDPNKIKEVVNATNEDLNL